MRANNIKKVLVVGTILLFIGTAIIPSCGHKMERQSLPGSRGNILYVGGSGPGNYTKIQDAIDNASDGDTVFVYHGTYYEYNLKIYKLNLIGEDRNSTIIDGKGIFSEVIHIEKEVTIHGFTIQNAYSGVGFFIDGNNITISNNIITKCAQGIMLMGSLSQIEIFNNVFLNNTDLGICLLGGGCSIHDNYFLSNPAGISAGSGEEVFIDHNQFEDNDIGIEANGFRETISRNNFINNDQHVLLTSRTTLLLFPVLFYYKSQWSKNYWNDWNRTTPRPIRGSLEFYIFTFIGYPIKLFSLPFFQFDWHPAQKPYDIPGMK